jgi:hypothetical protein
VLTFARDGTLPADVVTLLLPDADLRAGIGRLERLPDAAGVRGYRYAREKQEHCFFYADSPANWMLANWSSDARFLYWSSDRHGAQRSLVICDGTYAEVGGHRVVASGQRVDYAEVISAGGATELRSSDPKHTVLHGSLDRVEMELAAPSTKQGTDV